MLSSVKRTMFFYVLSLEIAVFTLVWDLQELIEFYLKSIWNGGQGQNHAGFSTAQRIPAPRRCFCLSSLLHFSFYFTNQSPMAIMSAWLLLTYIHWYNSQYEWMIGWGGDLGVVSGAWPFFPIVCAFLSRRQLIRQWCGMCYLISLQWIHQLCPVIAISHTLSAHYNPHISHLTKSFL